ncbi:Spi family protease inhibitor [Mariniflexile ostreae]|uniref:Spi family protease inhibitor n=1 Tax=Mariniflexile ostreae TaxID=1520892 RepID=A0ABV5FAZ0_9FLAO
MKRTYLIITTIITLFFLGCETDNLKDEMATDKENQFVLNETEMLKVAGEVQFGSKTNLKSAAHNSNTKSTTVSQKLYDYKIINESGRPCYYIINYEGGGFIILAADKRSEPLLAYSYESSFPLNEKEIPDGLLEWKENTIKEIKELRNQKRVNDYVMERWNKAMKDGWPSIIPTPGDPPNELEKKC